LPFSKPDDPGEFLTILFDLIAQKRGIGNQAAEGMPRLSDYFAKTHNDKSFRQMSEMFGHHGMASHWSEHFPTNALVWASDSRDPFNDFHEYTYWYSKKCCYATREQKEAAAEKAYGSKKALDYQSYEWVPQTARRLVQRACIKSSLILCDWAFPIVMNQYTEEHQGDTSLESQIYSAVIGLDTSEEEMYEMGERIFNLERALMVREGRRREQDHLAPEFAVPTSQPIWYGNYEDGPTEEDNMYVDPDYFNNQLLDSWYQLLGWTSAGIPTRARLKELGVEGIADKLKL